MLDPVTDEGQSFENNRRCASTSELMKQEYEDKCLIDLVTSNLESSISETSGQSRTRSLLRRFEGKPMPISMEAFISRSDKKFIF